MITIVTTLRGPLVGPLVGLLLGLSLTQHTSAAPLFPPALAVPGELGGVEVGMTRAQAQPALRAFRLDEGYRDAASRTRWIRSAAGGAKFYVLLAGDVVSRIGIEAPAAGLVAKLTRLWGKPATVVNAASEGVTSWSRGDVRVDLACRQALCRLAFHRVLAPEFFGSAVAPPAALAVAKLGMTRDQLAAVAPAFAAGTEVPAGPEDVRLGVDVATDGRLRAIAIVGLPPRAGELMTRAWGPAVDIASVPTWFNPKAGMRARYDAQLGVVQLTEYMPVGALLGPGDTLAVPLLGLTAQQLAKVYPRFQAATGGATVALPPTEMAASPTVIGVQLDPATGRAVRATFAIPFDTAARKAELTALLAAKWGPPRALVGGGQTRLSYAKARVGVRVDDAAGALVIDVR